MLQKKSTPLKSRDVNVATEPIKGQKTSSVSSTGSEGLSSPEEPKIKNQAGQQQKSAIPPVVPMKDQKNTVGSKGMEHSTVSDRDGAAKNTISCSKPSGEKEKGLKSVLSFGSLAKRAVSNKRDALHSVGEEPMNESYSSYRDNSRVVESSDDDDDDTVDEETDKSSTGGNSKSGNLNDGQRRDEQDESAMSYRDSSVINLISSDEESDSDRESFSAAKPVKPLSKPVSNTAIHSGSAGLTQRQVVVSSSSSSSEDSSADEAEQDKPLQKTERWVGTSSSSSSAEEAKGDKHLQQANIRKQDLYESSLAERLLKTGASAKSEPEVTTMVLGGKTYKVIKKAPNASTDAATTENRATGDTLKESALSTKVEKVSANAGAMSGEGKNEPQNNSIKIINASESKSSDATASVSLQQVSNDLCKHVRQRDELNRRLEQQKVC